MRRTRNRRSRPEVRPRRVACLLMLGAAVAPALAAAEGAGAATYPVYSCKGPDGLPAGLDGWTRSTVGENQASASYCGRGSYWILFMRGETSHASGAANEAVFTAPSGTTITGYEIWRAARVYKSSAFNYSYALMEGRRETVIERCDGNTGCWYRGSSRDPDASINRVGRSGLQNVGRLWVSLGCRSSAACGALAGDSPAKLWIHRAKITLQDMSSPVLASPPSGTLVDRSARLAGIEHVSLSATDTGGGVYEGLVEIDGQVVARQVIDPNGGRCKPPYTYAAPCKPSASGTIAVDTSLVPDGKHLLRLIVTDATGVNSAVWGPTRISTHNGSCNPRPRAPGLRMTAAILRREGRRLVRSRTVTTPYGRSVRLAGRLLTEQGAPVPGAQVCVSWRRQSEGARLRGSRMLSTDAGGRVAYRLGAGPSRTVLFVHRTPEGAVANAVRVNVRAPVRLKGSSRSLRNGETLVLSGRLPGRPRPRRGVLVELQARREGGWQTFGTTRSGSRGRFAFGYTFTRTTGVQAYALRARVPRQSAYPYASGASRPVRVRVFG